MPRFFSLFKHTPPHQVHASHLARPASGLQALEDRHLLSSTTFEDGVLTFQTGSTDDRITLVVRENKITLRTASGGQATTYTGVQTVIGLAGGGTDRLSIRLPAGEDGNGNADESGGRVVLKASKNQLIVQAGGMRLNLRGAERYFAIGAGDARLIVDDTDGADRIRYNDGVFKFNSDTDLADVTLVGRTLYRAIARLGGNDGDRLELRGNTNTSDRFEILDSAVKLSHTGFKLTTTGAKRVLAVADDAADFLDLRSLGEDIVDTIKDSQFSFSDDNWAVVAKDFERVGADWWESVWEKIQDELEDKFKNLF